MAIIGRNTRGSLGNLIMKMAVLVLLVGLQLQMPLGGHAMMLPEVMEKALGYRDPLFFEVYLPVMIDLKYFMEEEVTRGALDEFASRVRDRLRRYPLEAKKARLFRSLQSLQRQEHNANWYRVWDFLVCLGEKDKV